MSDAVPAHGMSWRGMCVRLAGLAFAAFLVCEGWIFWPVVIAIICLVD